MNREMLIKILDNGKNRKTKNPHFLTDGYGNFLDITSMTEKFYIYQSKNFDIYIEDGEIFIATSPWRRKIDTLFMEELQEIQRIKLLVEKFI